MTTPSLHVTDLACRRGGRVVFDGLSFSLNGGELLALTGPNGSGKTTLLRALAALGRADAWARSPGNEADIAWLGHLDGLKGDLTVLENIDVAEERGCTRRRAGRRSRRVPLYLSFDLV